MKNNSTEIIKRQLLIIKFLLKGKTVSTRQIQEYLSANKLDINLRVIQRDLVTLEEIFPIECRKDDKPYSWRWKRLDNTVISELTLSQAIVLKLVEAELKGVIPEDLYDSLQPLFLKANMLAGLSQIVDLGDIEPSQASAVGQDTKGVFHQKGGGFYPVSPWRQIIMMLRTKYAYYKSLHEVNKIEGLSESDIHQITDGFEFGSQEDKEALDELNVFLEGNGFDGVDVFFKD